MKDFKFYCTSGASGHGNWLEPIGGQEERTLSKADVLILGGGADISPSTYGEEPARGTYTSPEREKIEIEDFRAAQRLGIVTVGICRGHQLACALAGGKIIQDVTGHTGSHAMSTYDDQNIVTNSLHHQMINPYNLNTKDYRILAWSTKRLSNYYIGARNKRMYMPIQFLEIEAAVFYKIKTIGFQYHPEMMFHSSRKSAAVDWTQRTFLKFFEGQI